MGELANLLETGVESIVITPEKVRALRVKGVGGALDNIVVPEACYVTKEGENWLEDLKEYGKNLKCFYLLTSRDTDLRFLASFTHLTELHVNNSTSADWSFLRWLRNLEQLVIVNSTAPGVLRDVGWLCNKQASEFEQQVLSDPSGVVSTKLLKKLVVVNCGVTDISPLDGYNMLEIMNIENVEFGWQENILRGEIK